MLLGAAKTTPRLKRWLQGESFSTTRDRNASDTFYDPPPTQGGVHSPFGQAMCVLMGRPVYFYFFRFDLIP